MKLDVPILMPDTKRESFFNGDDLKSATYSFKCANCNNNIIVNCYSIYIESWLNDFSKSSLKKIEKHFSISSKKCISLSGGWLSISKHYCCQCGIPHIVVADFDEYRNSVYEITIQGIVRCW